LGCDVIKIARAHTHSFASPTVAFRELATRRIHYAWDTRIICRQFIQSAETNIFGMARRQSAAAGSCPCLLHCVFTGAAGSLATRNRWLPFPERSGRGLEDSDGTNELFSR